MISAVARKWLVLLAFACQTDLLAQITEHTLQLPSVEERLGVAIAMHDRTQLAADVFLPHGGAGRWPAILVRTPYDRKAPSTASYRFFSRRGYAVVIQDVRGRYASEGLFGPIEQEGADGNDTINWIAAQPWSNGSVAMVGSSYLGMAQWWAAIQNNPHLVTISPMCSGDDEYLDRFYSTGGALKIGHRLLWFAENFTPPSHVKPLLDSYIGHLPLRTSDLAASGTILPMWRDALAHPSYDAYWKSQSVRESLRTINIPVLSLGGWFDNYAESDLDAFSRLVARHETAAGHQVVETWIGPWSHNPGWPFPTRDFGPKAHLQIRNKQADWFDRWLKPVSERDESAASSLHIFVMGPNIWREEHEWPLARTRYTPLYIGSAGHANSLTGDGRLQWQPLRESQPDNFTYDPKTPVPTVGGSICCEPKIFPPGPLDQSAVERRADVLVYTSPPLTEDIEVTGPVRAILYIATSANDPDFVAKLVDVGRDGKPLLVTDGLQRLRYRLSIDRPVFVKRNTAYQISIDAGVTSYVFMPGHRIRLEVTSSNFPRFDRNLNSPKPASDESKTTKARQTVFHEKGYPSAIILPIIPRSASGHQGSLRSSQAASPKEKYRDG